MVFSWTWKAKGQNIFRKGDENRGKKMIYVIIYLCWARWFTIEWTLIWFQAWRCKLGKRAMAPTHRTSDSVVLRCSCWVHPRSHPSPSHTLQLQLHLTLQAMATTIATICSLNSISNWDHPVHYLHVYRHKKGQHRFTVDLRSYNGNTFNISLLIEICISI